MKISKIVVAGNVGVGKTNFVRTISEIEVVSTERRATTCKTKLIKENTTVAFDFGKLTIEPGIILHIYGTPGQSRFKFMWEFIIDQADAYVLLVSANQLQEFHDAKQIFTFLNQKSQIPMIIGLTNTDDQDAWQPKDIAIALGFHNSEGAPEMIAVDVKNYNSVLSCLKLLLKQLPLKSATQ